MLYSEWAAETLFFVGRYVRNKQSDKFALILLSCIISEKLLIVF